MSIYLKENAIFVMSCFNFGSVCEIGKVYLFYEEGLLIEKINTSVSWFTVNLPPVIHLGVSHVQDFISKYKLIHLE